MGHCPAAFCDGYSGVCRSGNGFDSANLLCRYLCGSGPYGAGRRCGFGRLLRPDGGLRRDEFSVEQMGRTCQSGTWHQYAADGEYPQKPADMDSAYSYQYDYGTRGYLPFPFGDERRCGEFRYGYLRIVWANRGLDRLERSHGF